LIPDKGHKQERFLADPANLKFAQFMRDVLFLDKAKNVLDNPAIVYNKAYDDIYDRWSDEFAYIEGLEDEKSIHYIRDEKARAKARDIYLNGNRVFLRDYIARQGYKLYVPERFINRYADWRLLNREGTPPDWLKNEPWYEDDWYLMEHPAFYEEVYLGLFELEKRDFSKVPTREVWALYVRYVEDIPQGQPRINFRIDHPELDAWLLLVGKVTKPASEKGRKKPTPWEKTWEEIAKKKRWVDILKGL